MVISMKLHSTREEIDQVRKRIEHFGYKVHSIEGEERVVIGVVGVGDVTACLESVEAMPQVESAVRISAPYKFVSREFRRGKTQIRINGVEIGGDEFVVMAGPVLGGVGRADHECRGNRRPRGRENASRRGIQASDFAL